MVVAGSFAGTATSLLGWCPNFVIAGLQLVVPPGALASMAVAVAALVTGHLLLAGAGAVVVASAVPLLVPKLVPDRRRVQFHWPTASVTVTLANLYVGNPQPDAAIRQLLESGAELLVMTELSTDLLQRFDRLGGAEQYPSRVHPDPVVGDYVAGIFSRTPLEDARVEQRDELRLVAATWVGRGARVAVRAVHPDAPSTPGSFRRWRSQLRSLRAVLDELDGPAIVLGDFNAGNVQVPFEQLLQGRFRDGHAMLGKALKPSWGTVPWLPGWFPALVARLDHVLISPELHPRTVGDLEPIGSDHRPFRAVLDLS